MGTSAGANSALPPGTPVAAAPAANTAAVVTLAAPAAGRRNVITSILASYAQTPTTLPASVTATDGSANYIYNFVTAIPFSPVIAGGGIQWAVATAVTITLTAGGAGVQGVVSVASIIA